MMSDAREVGRNVILGRNVAAQREVLWLQIFERVVSGKILFFGFVVRKLETPHRSNRQADATAATRGFLFGLQLFELCGLEPRRALERSATTAAAQICWDREADQIRSSAHTLSWA
jgi:hypothetical protein